MHQSAAVVIGVAFWLFVTVATVVGVVADFKKRRLELEPLRAAIERGQQLDPAIVERLMTRGEHEDALNPLYLRIGGIMTIAAGVGIALLSWFIRLLLPPAVLPVVGVGLLAVCVGIGLVIAAAAVERTPAGPRGGGSGA